MMNESLQLHDCDFEEKIEVGRKKLEIEEVIQEETEEEIDEVRSVSGIEGSLFGPSFEYVDPTGH